MKNSFTSPGDGRRGDRPIIRDIPITDDSEAAASEPGATDSAENDRRANDARARDPRAGDPRASDPRAGETMAEEAANDEAVNEPVPIPGSGGEAAVDPFYEAARAAEDRYIRLMADFENYRRRAVRERQAAEASAVDGVVRPLLDVLDNLERALAHSENSPGPLRDGVALTVRQFQEALRLSGVASIEPRSGEAFDPAQHEAVSLQPSAQVPADHVMQVVSRGYRYADRIIRPARVVVSRGSEGRAAS